MVEISYDDNLKFTGNLEELEKWKELNCVDEEELLIISIIEV